MLKKILLVLLILAAGLAVGWFSYPTTQKFFTRSTGFQRNNDSPGLGQYSTELPEIQGPFSQTVRSSFPSVVNISTVKVNRPSASYNEDPFFDFFNDFFNPGTSKGPEGNWKEQSFGSGVLVTEDGYIITNNHVVEDAERIRVTLYDGRIFRGQIIGADPKTDLAVVKISADGLPVLPWGDSDRLSVGQFVLAIGNPFGLSHTVTMGIVSAVGRANVGIADYEDFIQTDAAINPGNSGGPLVSADGRLIGINTAIFSRSGGYQGIGFAVPSNMARLVMEQLVTEGRVIRGWLGVSIQELTPELSRKFGHASTEGALVAEAMPESPARSAGIKAGDIVIEYSGAPVSGPAELKNLVAQSQPGTRVPVKIIREGTQLRTIVTVKELPSEAHQSPVQRKASRPGHGATYGISVIALTEDIARQLGVKSTSGGVVVSGIREGSPSDDAGLKRGDIIMSIEHNRVLNTDSFKQLVTEPVSAEIMLMHINRGGRKFYITMDISS